MACRVFIAGTLSPLIIPRDTIIRLPRRREAGVMQVLFWGAWRWCFQ